jgi:hypothetical protein
MRKRLIYRLLLVLLPMVSPFNMLYDIVLITIDVVMQYCFGFHAKRLEAEGFDPEYYEITSNGVKATAFMRHFNWILKIFISAPDFIGARMGPSLKASISTKNASLVRSLLK